MKETGKEESERFYQSCKDKEQCFMQISYTHKEEAGKRAIRKGGVGSSRRL